MNGAACRTSTVDLKYWLDDTYSHKLNRKALVQAQIAAHGRLYSEDEEGSESEFDDFGGDYDAG